jgi:hypothetical protein
LAYTIVYYIIEVKKCMGRHKMEAFIVAYKEEYKDMQKRVKQSKTTSCSVRVLSFFCHALL